MEKLFWALVAYLLHDPTPFYYTGRIKFGQPVFSPLASDAEAFPNDLAAILAKLALGDKGKNLKIEEHLLAQPPVK